MKLKRTLLLSFHALVLALPAHALETSFFYNGTLKDGGVPANGQYNLRFTLYNDPINGDAVGSPQIITANAVQISGGLFTVKLDFGGAPYNGAPLWLEVQAKTNDVPSSFTLLAPRQPLGPVPYAVFAGVAGSVTNNAIGSAAVVDGAITGSKLSSASVATDKIAPAAVTSDKLGANAVSTDKLADGSVTPPKLATDNAPGSGQILSYSGTTMSWTDPPDASGAGWSLLGNAGLAPGAFLGSTDNKPVEFRVNDATSFRMDYGFASGPTPAPNIIGGAGANSAINDPINPSGGMTIAGGGAAGQPNTIDKSSFATIGGGSANSISVGASWAVIAGGNQNDVGAGASFLGSGSLNQIGSSGAFSVLAGGSENSVAGQYAFLGGGLENVVQADSAVVVGGRQNVNQAQDGFIGSGVANHADFGAYSALVSGQYNTVGGNLTFVGGGIWNTNLADKSTIAGGEQNLIETGSNSTIGGGYKNRAGVYAATVAGGAENNALNQTATVSGGWKNSALSISSTVSGGSLNTVDATTAHGTIGGGQENFITGGSTAATISGGIYNSNSANFATIGGGFNNIASGQDAVISGGSGNRALAGQSTVSGGIRNTNYSSEAVISGGSENSIGTTSDGTTIGGGHQNTVGNQAPNATIGGGFQQAILSSTATIAGGSVNTIDSGANGSSIGGGSGNQIQTGANYATVPGGRQALARSYGQLAFASGSFSTPGDAQASTYVLRGTTTSATPTELFLDGPGFATARMKVPDEAVWAFDILIVAKRNDQVAGYSIKGVIEHYALSGLFTHIAPATVLFEDISTWDVIVEEDAANQALIIKATGDGGAPIRWVASVRTVELIR